MAFDVLMADGASTCALPWAARRELLEELHRQGGDHAWRVNTAFADGAGLMAATAEMGLEGVVTKQVSSRYQPGRRSPAWRKLKHRKVEWFDLARWRRPAGRDVGGLVAMESVCFVSCAFPALPGPERERVACILGAHGSETTGGVDLCPGVAEVEVAYLERLPDGRLREPVARAVRAGT